MTARYPHPDPGQVVHGENPQTAVRQTFRKELSRILGLDLTTYQHLPVLLGFILVATRPPPPEHTQGEPSIIVAPVMLLRCPGFIELHARKHLRPDCVLDVRHASVKGKTHAIMAMSDAQLEDDMEQDNHKHLLRPPNLIGQALQKAAESQGATCRHWQVRGGTDSWNVILKETRRAEAIMGLPEGLFAKVVQQLTDIRTPSQAVDVMDLLEELGIIPPVADPDQ